MTHDQEEALSISDRVVVMNGGIAEQVGTPFEIYNRPRTRFVANFVGTLNLLEADVLDPATGRLRIGGAEVALGRQVAPGRVTVAMRPEVVSLGRVEGADVVLTGRIDDVHFLGSVIRIEASLPGGRVLLDTFNRPDFPPPARGTEAEFSIRSEDLLVLT